MAESGLGATDWPAETVLRLLATIAALATPSPIAAPSPSSEALRDAKEKYCRDLGIPKIDGHTGETFEAGWDAHAAALRAPTIAAPSPSNEVTDEMVEACAKSLLTSSADAYHAWLSRTDSAWVVLRAAIQAALKAHKPSPSQADDAALNDPCIEEIEAVASALYETQDPINPTPFNVACHPECVELSQRYKRDAALAISVFLRERREILRNRAALAERGASDK
jgi:hypothetical protein